MRWFEELVLWNYVERPGAYGFVVTSETGHQKEYEITERGWKSLEREWVRMESAAGSAEGSHTD